MNDAMSYRDGGDTTLVPAALRVYRHFKLDTPRHELTSVTQACSRYPPTGDVYRAECYHPITYLYSIPPHDAPGRDCKCGFYASYSPSTDFYTDEVRLPDPHTFFLVRGVVEVSGRVQMASKGVRAEKLRIIAIGYDDSKIVQRDPLIIHGTTPRSRKEAVHIAQQAVAATAERYNVPWFPNLAAMHEAFPQPDLTHLLAPGK